MEIPVITRMADFEASINSLTTPSLISRFLSIFELGKLSIYHRLWKWGALFFAFVYAISSVINKIKLLILHYHLHKSKPLLASEPLLSHFNDEFYSEGEEEEEDDDVCSSSASSDQEEEEEAVGPNSSYEDFRVKGSLSNFSENPWQKSKFRNSFSFSDLVDGNNVVKMWDGYSSIPAPAVYMSPAVIISSGDGEDGKLGLGLWDLRSDRRSAAVHVEWRSDRRGRVVGIDSGRTGKVYLKDDVSKSLAVGDVRMLDTPLENSTTEYREDNSWCWWDADGVISVNDSTNEFVD